MTDAGDRWNGKAARPLALPACFLALLALAAVSSGCATNSYMGIALAPGAAPAGLQQLARRAQGGDKQAQLALGIRYEEGDGVAPDRRQAMTLYRLAARASGGTLWVYAPSPGNGAPARVIPVDGGQRQAGLSEAKLRLTNKSSHALPCRAQNDKSLDAGHMTCVPEVEPSYTLGEGLE